MSTTVRPPSRLARTLRSLFAISLLGAGLIAYNVFTSARDLRLATGPMGEDQQAFFVDAASRPDITTFFKNLTSAQRLAMSRNIGRYDRPPLAKLCGTLLADFDPVAREALTQSLSHIAQSHADAVAVELKNKGSFQVLGVSRALRSVGASAIPEIAKQLGSADARPNAVAYLVAVGKPAIPPLLPLLDDKSKDVRLAAADALGKIRSHEAVPLLVAKLAGGAPDEKLGYLSALAAIGDPSSEKLMAGVLEDEKLPIPERTQAALGLGRIASRSAAEALWKFVEYPDATLSQGVLNALQLCADQSLAIPRQPDPLRLKVAEGVFSSRADQVIGELLRNPQLQTEAARAAKARPRLALSLQSALLQHAAGSGEFKDAAITSLLTTDEGRKRAESLHQDPELSGFIDRRRAMALG